MNLCVVKIGVKALGSLTRWHSAGIHAHSLASHRSTRHHPVGNTTLRERERERESKKERKR